MGFWERQLAGRSDPAVDAGWEAPPARKGFFTDTSICIGCKACEVACKQWNGIPMDRLGMTGNSYDNSISLGASTWRHVAFVEQSSERIAAARESGARLVSLGMPALRTDDGRPPLPSATAPRIGGEPLGGLPMGGPGTTPATAPQLEPGCGCGSGGCGSGARGPATGATAWSAPIGGSAGGCGSGGCGCGPDRGTPVPAAHLHATPPSEADAATAPVGPGTTDLAAARDAAVQAAASGTVPDFRWLIASDVCKHCTHAGCLDVCPTGALFRTEFGTVVVQDDVCNGCGYCVAACPFGVIERREAPPAAEAKWSVEVNVGIAQKCTLCYDRLEANATPACAQACPTTSIQFGDLSEMRRRAQERVDRLHENGFTEARVYGANENDGVGGTGAVFLLLDEPETYGLPPDPVVTTAHLPDIYAKAGLAALAMVGIAAGAFLGGRR